MVLHRIGVFLLIATLVLAPLPFGSNRPLAWSVLSLSSAIIAILYFTRMALSPRSVQHDFSRYRFALLIFAGVVIYIFLQHSVFPPHPVIADIRQRVIALDGQEHSALRGISNYFDINAAQTGVMRLICYALLFFAALQYGRDAATAKRIMGALVISGGAYAAYGVISLITGNEYILWLPRYAYSEVLASTFINRNSYATYAVLVCAVCFCLLLERWGKQGEGRSLIRRFFERIQDPRITSYILVLLLLIISVVLTKSRGGLAALGVGLVSAYAAHLAVKRVQGEASRASVVRFALMIFAGFVVLVLLAPNMFDRFGKLGDSSVSRMQIYEITLLGIKDRPLQGVGYNAFEDAYGLYRDGSMGVKRFEPRVDHAHNTYLENALELGIPASMLLLCLFAWMVYRSYICIKHRKRGKYFGAVGLSCTIAVGFHALFDFSMEIPAIAAIYSIIMGVVVAQSYSSQDEGKHPTNLHALMRRAVAVAIVVPLLTYGVFAVQNIRAEIVALPASALLYDARNRKSLKVEEARIILDARMKSVAMRDNAQYYNDISFAHMALAHKEGLGTHAGLEHMREAHAALQNSLALAPADSFGWAQLAHLERLLYPPSRALAVFVHNSYETGRNIPRLQYIRLRIAMDTWDHFTEDERRAVEEVMIHLWKSDSKEFLRQMRSHAHTDALRAIVE